VAGDSLGTVDWPKTELRRVIFGLKINHPEIGQLLCDAAAGLSETAGQRLIGSPGILP
jgi:hypothetical protein